MENIGLKNTGSAVTLWLCRDGQVPDDDRTAQADLIAQNEVEMCRMLCGLADC